MSNRSSDPHFAVVTGLAGTFRGRVIEPRRGEIARRMTVVTGGVGAHVICRLPFGTAAVVALRTLNGRALKGPPVVACAALRGAVNAGKGKPRHEMVEVALQGAARVPRKKQQRTPERAAVPRMPVHRAAAPRNVVVE